MASRGRALRAGSSKGHKWNFRKAQRTRPLLDTHATEPKARSESDARAPCRLRRHSRSRREETPRVSADRGTDEEIGACTQQKSLQRSAGGSVSPATRSSIGGLTPSLEGQEQRTNGACCGS